MLPVSMAAMAAMAGLRVGREVTPRHQREAPEGDGGRPTGWGGDSGPPKKGRGGPLLRNRAQWRAPPRCACRDWSGSIGCDRRLYGVRSHPGGEDRG